MGWDTIVLIFRNLQSAGSVFFGVTNNALVLVAYIAEQMLAKYHLIQHNRPVRRPLILLIICLIPANLFLDGRQQIP